MIKVLFVCHGNICRSPAAEIIFRAMVQKENLDVATESRATSSEEIWDNVGNPIYPPMRTELERRGYSCGGKRAELLHKKDYDSFDYLIGMDQMNIRNMNRILGGDPKNKIRMMMDFTDHPGEVPDPWYTGNFKQVADSIEEGCIGLIQYLKQERDRKNG